MTLDNEYMPLHFCQNPYNVQQQQQWNLNMEFGYLGDLDDMEFGW